MQFSSNIPSTTKGKWLGTGYSFEEAISSNCFWSLEWYVLQVDTTSFLLILYKHAGHLNICQVEDRIKCLPGHYSSTPERLKSFIYHSYRYIQGIDLSQLKQFLSQTGIRMRWAKE